IRLVLQHIAIAQVPDDAVVIVAGLIHVDVGSDAQGARAVADLLKFGCIKPTSVDGDGVDLVSFFFGEVLDAIRCVESAAERQDNFLLHSHKGLEHPGVTWASCFPVWLQGKPKVELNAETSKEFRREIPSGKESDILLPGEKSEDREFLLCLDVASAGSVSLL